jgi:hypothetical protein
MWIEVDAAGRVRQVRSVPLLRPENLAEEIRRLKAESEVPLRTIGSLSVAQQLITAGVVDRLRLMTFPLFARGCYELSHRFESLERPHASRLSPDGLPCHPSEPDTRAWASMREKKFITGSRDAGREPAFANVASAGPLPCRPPCVR